MVIQKLRYHRAGFQEWIWEPRWVLEIGFSSQSCQTQSDITIQWMIHFILRTNRLQCLFEMETGLDTNQITQSKGYHVFSRCVSYERPASVVPLTRRKVSVLSCSRWQRRLLYFTPTPTLDYTGLSLLRSQQHAARYSWSCDRSKLAVPHCRRSDMQSGKAHG